jgi:hypothetical protein
MKSVIEILLLLVRWLKPTAIKPMAIKPPVMGYYFILPDVVRADGGHPRHSIKVRRNSPGHTNKVSNQRSRAPP